MTLAAVDSAAGAAEVLSANTSGAGVTWAVREASVAGARVGAARASSTAGTLVVPAAGAVVLTASGVVLRAVSGATTPVEASTILVSAAVALGRAAASARVLIAETSGS